MANETFGEILHMIEIACNQHLYDGARRYEEKIIECATQIYIAQMKGGKTDGE